MRNPMQTFDSNFGQRIKYLREARKWSLQYVANHVGLSKAHVWTLERGESDNPGLKTIHAFCHLFKLPASALTETRETVEYLK